MFNISFILFLLVNRIFVKESNIINDNSSFIAFIRNRAEHVDHSYFFFFYAFIVSCFFLSFTCNFTMTFTVVIDIDVVFDGDFLNEKLRP